MSGYVSVASFCSSVAWTIPDGFDSVPNFPNPPPTFLNRLRYFLSPRRCLLQPFLPPFCLLKRCSLVVRKCSAHLVLRPTLFLPDNRPLSIDTDRAPRARPPGGSRLAHPGRSSQSFHHSQHHMPYPMGSSDRPSFGPDFGSRRRPKDSLSVLPSLPNAKSKLQNVKQRSSNLFPRPALKLSRVWLTPRTRSPSSSGALPWRNAKVALEFAGPRSPDRMRRAPSCRQCHWCS